MKKLMLAVVLLSFFAFVFNVQAQKKEKYLILVGIVINNGHQTMNPDGDAQVEKSLTAGEMYVYIPIIMFLKLMGVIAYVVWIIEK